MPEITYFSPDGTQTTLDARDGDSVMETAVKNGVKGIVAECGGACACATCHVYVDEAFTDAVGEPGDLEDDMLDGTAAERLPNSRLSCQLKMNPALNGLTVRIAPKQI
ncbi:2Fe-2S ferredoxin [Rhodoglobus vestalii]|uniref:2Fe-2S ferredoxin n=1 Tax=Rhodoglobus vestalii TaxID=193384 RepID=A0A8H2K7H1_9MICO|nr:2Fe-2S iron-sulfur cluster-binding protein [Rhodoglobus vestalii]TQO20585.1 2Fe-2S ferredoxin [Rhodoglobus vestalii]